jgi:hypothetical protein
MVGEGSKLRVGYNDMMTQMRSKMRRDGEADHAETNGYCRRR